MPAVTKLIAIRKISKFIKITAPIFYLGPYGDPKGFWALVRLLLLRFGPAFFCWIHNSISYKFLMTRVTRNHVFMANFDAEICKHRKKVICVMIIGLVIIYFLLINILSNESIWIVFEFLKFIFLHFLGLVFRSEKQIIKCLF